MGIRDMFKWAEVKKRTDVYTWRGTTRWGNHDLYPIPAKEHTFGIMAYLFFWANSGTSILTYTMGSSYIAIGLSAAETITACIVGAIISAIIGAYGARPGQDYSIGYTVQNRSCFGMRGTYLPIFVVFLGGIVFSGIQAYYGGQAIALMLRAIFPSFKNMPNTLPASAAITTQNLIGFLIFTAVYLPTFYFIKPHNLKWALYPAFIAVSATFTGLLIWALVSNGGTGNLLSSGIQITKSQKAFRFIQCVSSISGSWGGSADRYSDWSRFEKTRRASLLGLLSLPVVIGLSVTFGVLTTTATSQMYGTVQWNPILLLESIQEHSYTPACRAATFFVGLALWGAQTFLNMSLNTIPYGMDVAGAFPRYFTNRRAGFMLIIITLIIQPWRFLSQALIFVTILNCITVYFAAATAILISDFWIIRKKMLKMPDLYTRDGIYWFTGGWNCRAIAALSIGMLPSMPGFFESCISSTADGAAVKIFQITWFVSTPLTLIAYLTINKIWPVEGRGVKEFLPQEDEPSTVIEASEGSGSDEKIPAVTVKSADEGSVV